MQSHTWYSEYEVSIDSKVFYLGFTKSSVFVVELKLELKPQANNIRISPTLIYDAIPPPIDWIWSLNWFWGGLLMVHQDLCFCGKNWMILQISTNHSFLYFFLIFFLFNKLIWLETVTRWNINFFFFLLRWHRHEEQEDGRKHWKT